MGLGDFRPRALDVCSDIRRVLRSRGQDGTVAECKEWTRTFIQGIVPTWRPGRTLEISEAQKVGAEFEKLLQQLR